MVASTLIPFSTHIKSVLLLLSTTLINICMVATTLIPFGAHIESVLLLNSNTCVVKIMSFWTCVLANTSMNTSDLSVNEEVTPLYTALHIPQIFIWFLTHHNHVHKTFQTDSDRCGLMCLAMIVETLLGGSRHVCLYLWPFDVSWLCSLFHMHFPPFFGSINHRCLLPQDWVGVVPCILYNGRLFMFSLYSCFYNLFSMIAKFGVCGLWCNLYFSKYSTCMISYKFIIVSYNVTSNITTSENTVHV